MNLRTGRIGRQESIAACAIMLTVSGLFSSDPRGELTNGNSAYLYLPLSLAAAFLAFLLADAAMKRCGARDLDGLFRRSLGCFVPAFGVVMALLLCAAGASVLNYFATLLHRYVFVDADYPELLFYCILPVLFMAWKGLECIARTAKLFAWVLLASLFAELLLASDAYEGYRLFPVLGEGASSMAKSAGGAIGLFLPAFFVLLICNEGLQGRENAKRYAVRGAIAAGILLFAACFCAALCFPYHDVAEVFSPLYRMSSLGRGHTYRLRADKILLFLWLAGGMIASAAYQYAAALQYARTFHIRDIRPAVGSFCFLTAGAVLFHQSMQGSFDLMAFITRYASAAFLLMLLLPCAIVLLKRTKERGEP